MLIIPAIDIKDNKCVRLFQGDFNRVTEFSKNPIEVAAKWFAAGTKRLHLIDLDGAKNAQSNSYEIIKNILVAFPDKEIQVGGGIRDEASLNKYFDLGVSFCILGTQAIKEPEFLQNMANKFPNKIILGLDAQNGMLATEGWLEVSKLKATEFLIKYSDLPLASIIYTDIAKDGMLSGVNLEQTTNIASITPHSVIASGGVKNLEDIKELLRANQTYNNLNGVIVGRSIYEGTLDLNEALALSNPS